MYICITIITMHLLLSTNTNLRNNENIYLTITKKSIGITFSVRVRCPHVAPALDVFQFMSPIIGLVTVLIHDMIHVLRMYIMVYSCITRVTSPWYLLPPSKIQQNRRLKFLFMLNLSLNNRGHITFNTVAEGKHCCGSGNAESWRCIRRGNF